ncbi:hypothetical protein BABINDRAFT_138112 [Babjeviella inositovora NRRL Y-12698]|uniref:DASH complex subunit DAM1 n=1 Tax=Babjeviella inositovora NRRL Y-12698 TaxID=984486 RepID=A0A1E3QQS8_9ASCO|nr:uncharacterized protein BABINDRAFT_138112 [Babjeviella inositovora NRRL Y-12698]ODQ79988.1 hypothetical protein BABINDRAFT_138112 [Babjeviella inositovora NRRL Y-12698]
MSRRLSRPSTPHRMSSRLSAILPQSPRIHYPVDPENLPLDNVLTQQIFSELSDSMGDLDLNCQNLQIVHESLTSFNESFASFLYGLQMNAWCVEFTEGPTKESFLHLEKMKNLEAQIHEAETDLAELMEASKSQAAADMPPPAPKPREEDDSSDAYGANESFIVQPKTKLPRPNLHQPPRYMRGITPKGSRIPALDKPGRKVSPNGQYISRKTALNPRPPFR